MPPHRPTHLIQLPVRSGPTTRVDGERPVRRPLRARGGVLLAVVNGWPAPESLASVFDWSVQALRVRTPQ
jgi:hypothetical protein